MEAELNINDYAGVQGLGVTMCREEGWGAGTGPWGPDKRHQRTCLLASGYCSPGSALHFVRFCPFFYCVLFFLVNVEVLFDITGRQKFSPDLLLICRLTSIFGIQKCLIFK